MEADPLTLPSMALSRAIMLEESCHCKLSYIAGLKSSSMMEKLKSFLFTNPSSQLGYTCTYVIF